MTGPCPPHSSLRAGPKPDDGYGQTIYWKLRSGEREEWEADFYAGTGISQDNMKFTDIQRVKCFPPDHEDSKRRKWDFNFPTADNFYNRDDLLNPKDTVKEAHSKLKAFGPSVADVAELIRTGLWAGSNEDLADALALPVLMV